MAVERPWEKSYPPGVRWDSHLEISTLPALLDEAVRRFADRTAIEYRDHCISYAELGRTSDALAAALIGLGVKSDVSVALYLPNTPYHPYFFFAVLKAGGRVVHLSPLGAGRELAYKLRNSGAKIVVTVQVGALPPDAPELKGARFVEHLIVLADGAVATL